MTRARNDFFLTGFMGVGKTRVGRELAKLAARPFVDLDAEIAERHQSTVSELFTQVGEEEFRRIETQTLSDLCSSRGGHADQIISLGGGAVLREANRELIRGAGVLIYLQASPRFLTSRLSKSYVRRPLLADCRTPEELLERITQLLAKRDPIYRQSSVVIPTDDKEPGAVARAIMKKLEAK